MPRQMILLPPPPTDQAKCSAGDLSIVSLNQTIRNQGRIMRRTYDFSATINAGSRSALTNITGVVYNKIGIVGVSVSSEFNTNWRLKFYSKDTGVNTVYNNNTFSGALDITGLSANANTVYEGDVEADLYYEDADSPTGSDHEIHVIVENTGGTNSKVFITIFYVEAD